MFLVPTTFILDMCLVFVALFVAFRYLRVWWSYIVSGEMLATLGMAMIWHWRTASGEVVDISNWYFMYAITQSSIILMLLFSLVCRRFLIIYAASALLALTAGVLAINGNYIQLAYYPATIGALDLAKVGAMVAYWYAFRDYRVPSGFHRLHLWQN